MKVNSVVSAVRSGIFVLGFLFLTAAPAFASTTSATGGSASASTNSTTPCGGSSFLGFPTWYKYLPSKVDSNGLCSPQLGSISDIWLIVAAVIEILLRVAALAAVVFVIVGGVRYIASQGNPDDTTQARNTIINALIGLLIAVMAAVFINFIAKSIS
ncbi:MAG TPA: hypothetical protein VLG13_00710 [Patescibacteria group bacterium]|nr:hypothetical protein [Patescibacteria group bacterium]